MKGTQALACMRTFMRSEVRDAVSLQTKSRWIVGEVLTTEHTKLEGCTKEEKLESTGGAYALAQHHTSHQCMVAYDCIGYFFMSRPLLSCWPLHVSMLLNNT